MKAFIAVIILSAAFSAAGAELSRAECFKRGHEAVEGAEKIKWFSKALELCREDEKIPKAWAYNNIAFTHIRNNKWDEALPLLEKSVAENEKIDVAWNNLGIVYENLFYGAKENKRDFLLKALRAYEKAIALKPEMEIYGLNKSRVKALAKVFDEGKKPEVK
ncbi:MAG: tetratricopeptide repeat protein [Candidatus Firestonebacteria bacterium]